MKFPEIKKLYNRLRHSAKKRNILFALTLTELNNFSFPLTCPIFNIPLKYSSNKIEDSTYSVDRIDSTKGYEIDNIIIISYKANRIKSNATKTELELLYKFYKNL